MAGLETGAATGAELNTVTAVISAVLMLAGGLSCLMGALGLVRLPDLPARLQATTKPQTLGLLLILLGVAVQLEFVNSSTLVLVVLFQVLTAPVISQVVGRSAYRTGAIDRDALVVDDLARQMDADAAVRTSAPDGGTGERNGSGGPDGGSGSGTGSGGTSGPDGTAGGRDPGA